MNTGDKDQTHEHVVVTRERRVIAQQPHAVDLKEALDDHRASQENRQDTAHAGDNGNEGIAQGMFHIDDFLGEALRFCGQDIVELDDIEQAVFHQHGEKRKTPDHVATQWQDEMADPVFNLAPEGRSS